MKRTIVIMGFIVIIMIGINLKNIYWGLSDFVADHQITEYGKVGRDTVLIIGNGKYQILNSPKGLNLIMYNSADVIEVVMSDIKNYKKYNNKVFIVSSEGYSIIYEKTNTCVAYISVEQQKYGGAYFEDDIGNITFIPHQIKDESFISLDTYDDFTREEKDIFEKMGQE